MSLLWLFRGAISDWMEERCSVFQSHEWNKYSYGKRRCVHCGEEQWLMQTTYPEIGEPALQWKSMRLPERFR